MPHGKVQTEPQSQAFRRPALKCLGFKGRDSQDNEDALDHL